MKRFLLVGKASLVGLFFLLSITSYSQSYSYKYDDYWGDWISYNSTYIHGIDIKGDYGGFVIYEKNQHPSEYFFKFYTSEYKKPTKREIKKRYKKNAWWVYSGKVEYYICDVYPTFKDCLKKLKRPLLKSDTESNSYNKSLSLLRASEISKTGHFTPIGYKKVSKSALIKIQAYKKHPECYNIQIWGEDVCYAIDLDNWYFSD